MKNWMKGFHFHYRKLSTHWPTIVEKQRVASVDMVHILRYISQLNVIRLSAVTINTCIILKLCFDLTFNYKRIISGIIDAEEQIALDDIGAYDEDSTAINPKRLLSINSEAETVFLLTCSVILTANYLALLSLYYVNRKLTLMACVLLGSSSLGSFPLLKVAFTNFDILLNYMAILSLICHATHTDYASNRRRNNISH